MKTEDSSIYYKSQKPKLLKFFDRQMKSGKKVMASQHGEPFAVAVAAEARKEYESLIPQLPYLDGGGIWTRQMYLVTVYLGIYKAMKRRGKTAAEAWKVCGDMMQDFMLSLPKFVRRQMRNFAFSKKQLGLYRKQAAEYRQHKNPDGDAFNFIEGDGKGFDYGMDITACAKCKFRLPDLDGK